MRHTSTGWSAFVAKLNPKIRPEAGGHRFGPDLQCTECGRYWEEHQRQPSPCSTSVSDPGDTYPAPESFESDTEGVKEGHDD